jgi:hypothetical protein
MIMILFQRFSSNLSELGKIQEGPDSLSNRETGCKKPGRGGSKDLSLPGLLFSLINPRGFAGPGIWIYRSQWITTPNQFHAEMAVAALEGHAR